MNYRQKYIVLLSCIILISACSSESKEIADHQVISEVLTNPINRNALTNNYHFKLYEDGVGMDSSRPDPNDTILIFRNNLSAHLKIEKINKGKVLLLDSLELCKLSHDYDQKRIIMRSFIHLSRNSKGEDLRAEIKNWVPQYLGESSKCIEIAF